MFVGSEHGPEGRLAEKEGVPFVSVPSGPIVGMLSTRTMRSLGRLGLGTLKAFSVLRSFRPDVLVGTGGYTSAGVALAEWLRGGKVVIHEQNSVPGRTNKILAKVARKVCVTFEESVSYLPAGKTIVTGLPVRPEIVAGKDQRAARAELGLDLDKFTLLVVGGSQGAKRINELVLEAAPMLIERGLQVFHQSGEKNYNGVVSGRPDAPGYIVRPYIEDMAAAYSAADLVLSRSGASTIAEITVRGLPAILIPYPYAHAAHQAKNAEALARVGAALAVEESELTGPALAGIVLDLAEDQPRLKSMSEAGKKLGRPNAAEEIVEVIKDVYGS